MWISDEKDWTWTLNQPCPDCGFNAGGTPPETIAQLVRAEVAKWPRVLGRRDARIRPGDNVWSPLEYACHVRDCCDVFAGRVQLILDTNDPTFPNWNQDAAAVENDYPAADPATVADEVLAAGERVAAHFDSVGPHQWERRGIRSNGSAFTTATLAQYFAHDLVHHGWDVGAD